MASSCWLCYAVEVRDYLNEIYSGRWIGRRGMSSSITRSFTITFFLRGHIKIKIYATLEELRERIAFECAQITEILRNVISRFDQNFYPCMADIFNKRLEIPEQGIVGRCLII